MKYEATHLRGRRYAVRPAGAIGTCGYYPSSWTVVYVDADSPEEALRLADLQRKRQGKAIIYNPRFDSGSRAFRHVRWIENVSRGLRLVGFADELTRAVAHRGWYGDEFGDTLYRGVVYRLPRGGFAYGYADPHNDDDCALLCFDCDAENAEQAARYADQFAQRYAEQERDYQAKWNARRIVDECRERICDARRRHTALVRAIWTGEGDDATGARLRANERENVREARATIEATIAEYGDDILGEEFA